MVFMQPAIKSQPLHQRGFSILKSLVVLSVVVGLMGLGSRYLQQHLDTNINQVTAYHLKQVANATTQYVQDHYQACSAQPPAMTIEDLVKAGYLPPKTSEKNNRNQHYRIQVLPEQTGKLARLQVLITTHQGQAIAENALRQVANLVGTNAGYISVLAPEKITGNQESWVLEGHGVPVEIGHLASLSFVNQTDVLDAGTFLRRTKVAGHPEYNKMETDLQIADASKIFFGKDQDDQQGMQLSQHQLSSKKDNSRILLNNQKTPEIIIEDSTEILSLRPNYMKIKYKSNTSRDEKSATLTYDKLEILNNTNFTSNFITIFPKEFELKRNEFQTLMNPNKITLKNNRNKKLATLENNKLSLTDEINSTELTDKSLQIEKDGYEMFIDSTIVSINNKNYDQPGWPIDSKKSRPRSQLDHTGVRIPFFRFTGSWNKEEIERYAKKICGSATSYSNEDGKIFAISRDPRLPIIFICAGGVVGAISSTDLF